MNINYIEQQILKAIDIERTRSARRRFLHDFRNY